MHTTWTLVKISREHSTGDRKLNFSNSRLSIRRVHWIHLNFKETACFLFFPPLSLEMTAALIKSKLFNLVASGRESLFRERMMPPAKGRQRGTPAGGGAERAPLHQFRRAGPDRSAAAASRYRGRDNDICVDSLYNNPNFLREAVAGCRAAAAEMYSSPRRYQGTPPQRSTLPARLGSERRRI